MGRIDLHIHTAASDGTDTPAEAAEKAAALGLAAIAVTDHGVAQAFPEAMNTARKVNSKEEKIKIIDFFDE